MQVTHMMLILYKFSEISVVKSIKFFTPDKLPIPVQLHLTKC